MDDNHSILMLQKHRIIKVGRDLLRLSGPSPLLKQDQLEQVAQHHEYLLGGDSTTSLGNLFQYLANFTVKNLFTCVQMKLRVFEFVPIAFLPLGISLFSIFIPSPCLPHSP